MDERKDFTISPLYEGLDEFVRDLHEVRIESQY